jgi:hypothetical protein
MRSRASNWGLVCLMGASMAAPVMSYAQIISPPGTGYGPQSPTRRVYQPPYLRSGANPSVNAPSNDPNADASAQATGLSSSQNPVALPSAPASDHFVKSPPAAKPPTAATAAAPGKLTTKQKIQVYGPTAAAIGLGVPGVALYVVGIGHNMFNAKNVVEKLVINNQTFRKVPHELVPKLKEMAAEAAKESAKTKRKIRITISEPLGSQMQKWGMRLLAISLVPRTIGGFQFALMNGQTPILVANLITLCGILPSLWMGREIMTAITSLGMGGFQALGQSNIYDKKTHVKDAHSYDMVNVEQILNQGKKEVANMSADVGEQLKGLMKGASDFITQPIRPGDKADLSEAVNLPEGRVTKAAVVSATIVGHMLEDMAQDSNKFLATMNNKELREAWFESKKASMKQTYDDIINNRGAGDRTRAASTLLLASAALVAGTNLPGVPERLGLWGKIPAGAAVFMGVAINDLAQIILGLHDIKHDSVPLGGLYAGGGALDVTGITWVSGGGNAQIGTALAQLGAVATNGAYSVDAAKTKAEELQGQQPPKPEAVTPKGAPGVMGNHPAASKPSPFKLSPPGAVPGAPPGVSNPGAMSFGNDIDADPVGPPRQGLRRDCGDPIHGIVTAPF